MRITQIQSPLGHSRFQYSSLARPKQRCGCTLDNIATLNQMSRVSKMESRHPRVAGIQFLFLILILILMTEFVFVRVLFNANRNHSLFMF